MKLRELIILMFSLLTVFFASQVNAATKSCNRLFSFNASSSEIPSIRVSDLTPMDELAYGVVTARTVRFRDRTFVSQDLASQADWTRHGALSAKTVVSLAKVGPSETQILLPVLSEREYYNIGLTLAERATYEVTWAVQSYLDSQKMQTLKYRGRTVAPVVAALIRNTDGLVVGRLIATTPGKAISELVDDKRMSVAQIDDAINQITEQVKLLAENGFSHNDVSEQNILVTIAKDRSYVSSEMRPVKARLIGFVPSVGKGRTSDEELERSLVSLVRIRAQLLDAAVKQRDDKTRVASTL